MALYDKIGKTYATTRTADPRIVDALERQLTLNPGSLVADIGAGTGTYAHALADRGLRLIAVEPSSVMRDQAVEHSRIEWREGSAEDVPLSDGSVDGVIATLAVHHFQILQRAAEEMVRISCGGPLVLFTFDPMLQSDLWLYDYFPRLWEDALKLYPSAERISEVLRHCGCRPVSYEEFPLPRDLRDRFAAAGWGEPELYLDAAVRMNMSPFQMIPESEVEAGVSRLRQELASGVWDGKHGHLRRRTESYVGYVFIHAITPGA